MAMILGMPEGPQRVSPLFVAECAQRVEFNENGCGRELIQGGVEKLGRSPLRKSIATRPSETRLQRCGKA